MAVGDRHVRQLETGDTYTPSSSLKEVITNIVTDPLAVLDIEYSGETNPITISPTLQRTSPRIQQYPNFVLTSDVTLSLRSRSLYVLTNNHIVHRVNPLNPGDTSAPFESIGSAPSIPSIGIGSIAGDANGDLVVVYYSSVSDNLVFIKLNPDDLSDTSGDYGEGNSISIIFAYSVSGAISGSNARSFTIDNAGDYWVGFFGNTNRDVVRFNPDDLSDSSGTYRSKQGLPSGLSEPRGIVFDNGGQGLYVADGNELWYLDAQDHTNTTTPYGVIGDMSSSLLASGLEIRSDGLLYVIDSSELWLVDPNDPDSEVGQLGLVGTGSFTNPRGMAMLTGSAVPVIARISTIEVN